MGPWKLILQKDFCGKGLFQGRGFLVTYGTFEDGLPPGKVTSKPGLPVTSHIRLREENESCFFA